MFRFVTVSDLYEPIDDGTTSKVTFVRLPILRAMVVSL